MINHIQMAKSDDRDDRPKIVFGHSGLGYGTIVTPFLSSDERIPYQRICKACDKAVKHPINADNFLEIIYVYKNNSNRRPKGGYNYNFFEIFARLTKDEFIEYTVRKLLDSTDTKIRGYSIPLDLRIVASKIPITAEELLGEELLGEYVIKKGVFEKHAFKPRKLKKPSRSKVSKSAKKRRNLKNKSKSKSKKRSPKPRRR